MTDRMPRADLVAQLGATVGLAKARNAIDAIATQLGIAEESFDQAQALLLLETLAAEAGILGIAARLLKVQITLRFNK